MARHRQPGKRGGDVTQSAPMARRLASLLAVVALTVVALAAQSPSAGTGTIFVGSYSGHLTAVDEATGSFTKIPLETGSAVRGAPLIRPLALLRAERQPGEASRWSTFAAGRASTRLR